MAPKSYIATIKPDATDAEVKKIKDDIVAKGGSIEHEYTLIKGFSFKLPENHVQTFKVHPKVESVEADQEMKTQ